MLRKKKTQDFNWTGVKDPSILKEIEFMPSTLETIDFAMYDYLNERMNLSTTSNEGFKKVPLFSIKAPFT